ncbi:MAG: hypothetical protein IPM54_42130 [Polyangiaceae bacterium]|nr:hypothetical protein [Polyangiaceae bacterium]
MHTIKEFASCFIERLSSRRVCWERGFFWLRAGAIRKRKERRADLPRRATGQPARQCGAGSAGAGGGGAGSNVGNPLADPPGPKDPNEAVKAAIIIGSCVPDDGIARHLNRMYTTRSFQRRRALEPHGSWPWAARRPENAREGRYGFVRVLACVQWRYVDRVRRRYAFHDRLRAIGLDVFHSEITGNATPTAPPVQQ